LLTAAGVQILFLYLALSAPIIFAASGNGILATVSIPAAERAAKITTSGIPGVGEKQYVTMPAARQAFSQVGFFLEN
jgi:hypothetical protein